jgi:hypothetical protein
MHKKLFVNLFGGYPPSFDKTAEKVCKFLNDQQKTLSG